MADHLRLGKSHLDLQTFTAAVTGGGRFGPGELFLFDGSQWQQLEFFADNRSGTLRSGSVTFDVSKPGLYRYVGVAIANNRAAKGYFEHTEDRQIVPLTDQQMQARQLELFPDYLVAQDAAKLRRLHDVAWTVEHLQRDWSSYHELVTSEVERIEAMLTMSLPTLRGSLRQVRWARQIRAAWAVRSPTSPQLMAQIDAKWWIDHKDFIATFVVTETSEDARQRRRMEREFGDVKAIIAREEARDYP